MEPRTDIIKDNGDGGVDSLISPAKVESVKNIYHSFAIFRVSSLGDNVTEISYIDYKNPTPQLVDSIEEATDTPSNQLVTRLNMADGSTIYFVETINDGKKTIIIERVDQNGKWLSAMKAVEVSKGVYNVLSDTKDILSSFNTQVSEYNGLTFKIVDKVKDGMASQEDDAISSTSEAQTSSAQHIWNLPNKPDPEKTTIEEEGKTIIVQSDEGIVEMDASNIRRLSGVFTSLNGESSSFPWWTLSFIALGPVAGIVWFVLRKRRKSKD